MIRLLLYLIIYVLCISSVCSCERIDIPGDEITVSDVQDEDSEEDEEGETSTDNVGDVDITSTGTLGNPYSVAEARTLQSATGVWVKGYIVGYISGTSISGANFSAQSVTNTNLLLADSMQERRVENCIPVELIAGTARRRELNLKDNPLNWGKHVVVKGNLTKYFKAVGMKSTSNYQWINDQTEEEEEQRLSVTWLKEDFTGYETGSTAIPVGWSVEGSALCTWTIGSVRTEKYAEVSYKGSGNNVAFESWLITPPLNFDRMENKMMSFNTLYENRDGNSRLDIFIMDKKSPSENIFFHQLDAPVACEELVVEGCWLHSGEISLHSYSGIKYIAFRYKGNAGSKASTTFCLDNIRLGDVGD